HELGKFRVADETRGAKAEIEQAQHAPPRQRTGEVFQRIELARRVAAADERADGGAGDDVGLDARARQGAEDADMRPAAGDAGAQCDADLRTGHAELLHGLQLLERCYSAAAGEAAAFSIWGSNVTEFEREAPRLNG